jgi:hypothetical protein
MVRLSFFTFEPLFDDAASMFEKIANPDHSKSDKPVAALIPPRLVFVSGAIGGLSPQ